MGAVMNIVTFASRKGGSGKSTLTAHLAVHACKPSRRLLLIDADSQGSLTIWHQIRGRFEPALKNGAGGIANILDRAKHEGIEWVLIDTPPNMSAVVGEAIRAATLVVVPARLSLFDLAAVRETIHVARELGTPYAVVMNAVPPRRDGAETTFVKRARDVLAQLNVPVWNGRITHRAAYYLAIESGEGAREYDNDPQAVSEIADLWSAIERSVKAINGMRRAPDLMHRIAS